MSEDGLTNSFFSSFLLAEPHNVVPGNKPRKAALSAPQDGPSDAVKRAFDVLGALVLLVALAPLLLLVAAAVKLCSPGPVIFRQERLTKGGRVFIMYKFRTMIPEAEEHTGAIWAEEDDARITGLGSFLRAFRLDELPQLLNVLRGEMSLVGPRPERPEIAEALFDVLPEFTRRLDVKAGVTGLAQIATGYASSLDAYRRKLAWDLLYIEKRSAALDLAILLRTVLVVVTRRGAR